MTSKPILVLGSNSFSGASFCAYLLKQGMEVIAVSRSEEPVASLLPYKWLNNNDLQFHQLDINHQLADIEALLDKFQVSHIYNFAAQSMVGQSWDFPEHWFQTNVVSTVKLHNMLRHKDYLERYIHVSTPEVYGHCEGLVKEHNHYHPSTPYAVSRAAADMSLHSFFDAYQFPVVFTRAANVYGEGQQLYRIVPRTILYALMGKTLELHGGGSSTRSFIHIDDVAAATLAIGEKGTNGRVYHISTDSMISIRDLVKMISDQLQVPFEALCQVTSDRLGKDAAYKLDSQKVRSEFGWSDQITLEQGIERTIHWVKTHVDELSQQPLHYLHKP
jgi:dTDP-glucose 4,6-dehydratase